MPESQASAWPFPYADDYEGRLSRRQWAVLCVAFVGWHVLALQIASLIGVFDPVPNPDHIQGMWEVLEKGYPRPAMVPPGLAYYMALKWTITDLLGWPYWSSKYFIDVFCTVSSGVLAVLLGRLLTRNRWLALASGLGLVSAPIFILLSAEEGAGVLFQPLFLLALLLFVWVLQGKKGPSIGGMAAAGAVMGVAVLVRGNAQFILVVLAPFAYWLLRKTAVLRPGRRALAATVVFFVAQFLVLLPWSLAERSHGMDGVTVVPNAYRGYYWSVRRHAGSNRISDWLQEHYDEPERSLTGVIDFNVRWLQEDPLGLVELYVLKFVRAWYLSESGHWDLPTLLLHCPYWVLAVLGWWFWRRKTRGDPAYVFLLLVILYMWTISAIAGGIARYSGPLYGFIGTLCGVAVLVLFEALGRRRIRTVPLGDADASNA